LFEDLEVRVSFRTSSFERNEDRWEAYLSLEVVPDELERVVESVDSSELDLGAGLLLPSSLYDGGEDLVRLGGKDLGFLLRSKK